MSTAFTKAVVVSLSFAVFGCDAGKRSQPGVDDTSGSGATSSSSAATGQTDAGMDPEAGPAIVGGYYVQGNQVLQESDGAPHRFRGVARPSLEWSRSGEALSLQDYQNMASWGANVVRIALNQAFWLRGADASAYQSFVNGNVVWAQQAGLDVILDLHWSDKGTTQDNLEQQRMADANSLTFWTQVGSMFKDNGRVLFELYNEPHDVPCDVWLNGGQSGDGFQVAGMQQLYNAVRATGAQNLVIVGGLDWAYDLGCVVTHHIDGYNVLYASHPYDLPHKLPEFWETDWGFVADTYPVIVTEFGVTRDGVSGGACDATGYYSDLINYANTKGIHWTAWAWYVGDCAFPSLLSAWDGTPTPAGQVVRTALSSP